MKHKRSALLTSLISLLLCLSMLVGTTFAWFTDYVVTGINTIAAGTLDVQLHHSNAAVTDEQVNAGTKLFMDLQGDPILWEPGVVSYENLRITNAGDLALTYQLSLSTDNENFVKDPSGAQYGLSQILKVGVVKGGITATDRDGVVASVEFFNWTTLADFIRSGSLLPVGAGKSEEVWGVVVYWQPGENDNLWNLNNGKTLTEGDVLSIDLGVRLIATQEQHESDSFGDDYDSKAAFPRAPLHLSVSAPVAATAEGTVSEPVTLSRKSEGVTAAIPEGVALADEASTLTLTIDALNESEADIQLEQGETKLPLDIHVEGVAEDNTVPMLITLENLLTPGLYSTSVELYHVEDGVTVTMTQVADPTNHNEYSYDPDTGTVVLCVASFSEYVAVTDDKNPWLGTIDTSWYNTSDKEFTLSNAAELAGFGAIVDGTAENIAADDFTGKTVKLDANINLNNQNFNPIGCGYVTGVENSNNAAGTAFKGTFDGQNYTISGLYQNGWDLGLSYCNLGGGLFASVCDATIRNLTISGANIVMECVEMGVVAGLSQGNCTYENINIVGCKIANYQRATGGLIGEVSPGPNGGGTTTITNVKIDSTTVVGSLWGDFDCPVGGVIGARWDDTNTTTVKMTNVDVACRLDVYNDVTSTYQWYAYRRAGMLIGNTDTPPADGKNSKIATADFLTCVKDTNGNNTVVVRYGDWINYTYCEFATENNTGRSWPWVRVQAGENCSAYSNPRYGHPKDANGAEVVDDNHAHVDGEGHLESIPFGQLYGGGQGVYGGGQEGNVSTHAGVTIESYDYTITYINNGKVLAVTYANNDTDVSTKNDTAAAAAVAGMGEDYEFSHWMNAGSTRIDSVSAGNTEDVVLYPSFVGVYTAIFVDQAGNILAWDTYTANNYSNITKLGENTTPPVITDCNFDHWEVHVTGDDGKVTATDIATYGFADDKDITIYPIYTYSGDVNLIPVDNDGDGVTDEYQVGGYNGGIGADLVEIPNSVNGVPVTSISAESLASYDDLHSVIIPSNVTTIGATAFADGKVIKDNIFGGTYDAEGTETVTLYYKGDKAAWDRVVKTDGWDANLGDGSRIFFLGADNKVDPSKGYIELCVKTYNTDKQYSWQSTWSSMDATWVFHNHPYPDADQVSDGQHTYEGTLCVDTAGNPQFHHATWTDYDGACDCKTCDGATRPDAEYWTAN